MRKFMRFPPRTLRFRSLLILAGALALLAAFTPRANADLLRYYNMEGVTVTPPYDVNLDSHLPAIEVGAGTTLVMDNGMDGAARTQYNPLFNVPAPGLTANLAAGDPAANLNSFGNIRSAGSDLGVQILMPSQTGFYNVQSVSFAYSRAGNGFQFVQLQISSNGGATFTNIGANVALPPGTPSGGTTITITLQNGTTLNIPQLALRLLFNTGQSNGVNLEFQIDNIQINGTVPEPATVAGGLLGVLGLCWFQRRRLIRSVRFRRT
jgi:hypothetical protein